MRHTFQITVDYTPNAANLAWMMNHAEAGASEQQTRKAFTKRLVLALIDQHAELTAIPRNMINDEIVNAALARIRNEGPPNANQHEHTHTHLWSQRQHTHQHGGHEAGDRASEAHAHYYAEADRFINIPPEPFVPKTPTGRPAKTHDCRPEAQS